MQFYKGEFDATLTTAQKSLQELQEIGIPPTPEMFELWYVYVSRIHTDVEREMKLLLSTPSGVTVEACQAIYAKYLSHDQNEIAIKRAGEQIQETILGVNQAVSDVRSQTEGYNKNLKKTVQFVQTTQDPNAIQSALGHLVTDTQKMVEMNERLDQELAKSTRVISDLQRDLEIVRREAMTDGLTGLANRKAFDRELNRMIQEAKEKHETFTLLMVDIDHFKSFNDNFGHQVGDQVLRLVGRALVDGIKGRDFASRYGGEEFAIILPQSNMTAGVAVGNSLRRAVASKDLVNRNTSEKLGQVTMSVGVAEYVNGESGEELIERADSALYTAKHNGRNQVAAAPGPAAHALA
jgi:diguanylate cyclase